MAFAMISSMDKTIASIDGEKINEDELYDALVAGYGADTLDLLITNKLVELEAEKAGIKIKDEEIQKEIDVMVESYGDEKSLKEQLEASGSSMEALKRTSWFTCKRKTGRTENNRNGRWNQYVFWR